MRTLTAVAVVFLAACGQQLPLQVYIDDSWSQTEEEVILAALEEWNVKTASAGFPNTTFVYQGRLADQYGEHARDDGRSVIYRAFKTPDIEGTKDSDYGLQVGGVSGDIILNVANLWPSIGTPAGIYHEPYSFPPDADEWSKDIVRENYRRRLKIVALHELGHLAGIEHTDGRQSRGIMNDGFSERYNELQPADVKAFCRLHGC